MAATVCAQTQQPPTQQPPAQQPPPSTSGPAFELPCADYGKGLRGRSNFGALITAKDSPFHGTYHLAEDVWLPAGTEVRSVAAGICRYSDFSPTWTDEARHVHWNLGNVIVIEHPLEPAVDGLDAVCSFYVHLAADRRVQRGDPVAKGQVIGRIGKDRSEENGRYPAHLHFGLHRGPYHQIPPALVRELTAAARTTGIVLGAERTIRGEIELIRQSDTSVLIRSKQDGASAVMSLLVGSTAPGKKPEDIMSWCEGYGDRETVDEWLCPSRWIAAHAGPVARAATGK